MQQLLYAPKEVEDLVRREYPDAIITDASDEVHPERFEVEIPNADEDTFYLFAIRQGFVGTSLSWGLMETMPESQQRLWNLLAEARALSESEKE